MSRVGAVSSALLIGASFLALSATAWAEPTLEFSNAPLKLTLADKQDTSMECDPATGEQEKVKKADSGPELKTAKATVWVRYADSAEVLKEVRFDARAKANSSDDAGAAWKDVSVCWQRVYEGQEGPGAVEPFEIFVEVGSPPQRNLPEWDGLLDLLGDQKDQEEYRDWFWNPSLPYQWSSLSGYLTVTADTAEGAAVPGTLALQLISPAQGYNSWFWYVMNRVAFYYFLFALVAGLVLVLASGVKSNFWKELDFDMKGGWASNLTTAGAVLGTVLSAGLLPDDPFYMAKAQYTALNLVFVLVLLLAFLLYRLFPRGFVLLVAAAAVLAAAAGELATVCLILYEIAFRGVLPAKIVPLIQIALVATGLMATWAAGKKFVEALRKGKALAEDKAVVQSFYKTWGEENPVKRDAAFERILAPFYKFHDSGGGNALDPEELKRAVTKEHETLREIRFEFDEQSSGEGRVSSQITKHAKAKADGAGDAPKEALLDICRVEGGTIAEQWTKKLPPDPTGARSETRWQELKQGLGWLGATIPRRAGRSGSRETQAEPSRNAPGTDPTNDEG